MPYVIKPSWGKWTVRKKFTGKLIGRVDTKPQAIAMVKAIYANERKSDGK